jgi:hypothetical protein
VSDIEYNIRDVYEISQDLHKVYDTEAELLNVLLDHFLDEIMCNEDKDQGS